jgi:putative cell wall-binding protein/Tol biopolymer transport system component
MRSRPGLVSVSLCALLGAVLVAPTGQAVAAANPGSTELVSIAPGAASASSSDVSDVTMSADGRFVAFVSRADNLTSAGGNDRLQVYLKSVESGEVSLVSHGLSGPLELGDNTSSAPTLSADGEWIAFSSSSSNLQPFTTFGMFQVYLQNTRTGATRLVSSSTAGTQGGNFDSARPVLSADGSRVVFDSGATDLVAGATPTNTQVYSAETRPVTGSSIKLMSLQDARRYADPDVGNWSSYDADITGDGKTVVFTSHAVNLVPNSSLGGTTQVFGHSLVDGHTWLISRDRSGNGPGNNSSSQPSISADGSRIAYTSLASNVTSNSSPGVGGADQILVQETAVGLTTIASIRHSDGMAGEEFSQTPDLSGDGRFVAFESEALGLTTQTKEPGHHVYLRDLRLGVTQLVSAVHSSSSTGASGLSFNPTVSASGGVVAFGSDSKGLTNVEVPGAASQAYRREPAPARVERIGGADRYAVSAAVSADRFAPGVDVAYVASGAGFADALAGGAAAGRQGGPVLLVEQARIPEAVRAELERLEPKRIVVLGGTVSVAAAVETELKSLTKEVTRVGGADRYEVSADLSHAVFPVRPDVAYVASGAVFSDALSGSAAAGRRGGPVLLVTKDAVPSAVKDELLRLKPREVVVLGGPATVSDAVVAQLGATRVSGRDRYEVSASISSKVFAPPRHTVYVASGAVFPDALSGSAAAIANGAPVILLPPTGIGAAATELDRLDPYRIVLLGGPATLPEATSADLEKFLVP